MPHTARARPASLVRGPGSQRPQLKKLLSSHVKQRVKKRTRPACSLITTPLLTELVKLTLSTSSVTNTNTIAAGTLAYAVPRQQSGASLSFLVNTAVCTCSFTSCWAQLSGMVQHLVCSDRFSRNMGCAPDQLFVAQPLRGLRGTRAKHPAEGAAFPSILCCCIQSQLT